MSTKKLSGGTIGLMPWLVSFFAIATEARPVKIGSELKRVSNAAVRARDDRSERSQSLTPGPELAPGSSVKVPFDFRTYSGAPARVFGRDMLQA